MRREGGLHLQGRGGCLLQELLIATCPHPSPPAISLTCSPCEAEPLLGNSTDPPQPYDPETVRSIVRWGVAGGLLTDTTEGSDRVTYTYTYSEGELRGPMGTSDRGQAGPGCR